MITFIVVAATGILIIILIILLSFLLFIILIPFIVCQLDDWSLENQTYQHRTITPTPMFILSITSLSVSSLLKVFLNS